MGWQIIKQPNGQYAVWSTGVDSFIAYDCSREELTEIYLDRLKRDYERDATERKSNVIKVCDDLDNDGKPYYQFTRSLEDCLRMMAANTSVEKAEEFQKYFFQGEVK